jgi:hypothetical protein
MRSLSVFARIFVVVAVVVACCGFAPVGSSPPGATAVGCHGEAGSVAEGGLPLDHVSAPGTGGTLEDPFDLSWTGPISWSGTTDKPVRSGTWDVSIEPVNGGLVGRAFALTVSSLAHGTVDNPSAKTQLSGVAKLGDYVPVRAVAGIYTVSWTLSGPDASCTGSAVVSIGGNPLTSAGFVLAIILILLGGVALLPLLRLLFGGGGKS